MIYLQNLVIISNDTHTKKCNKCKANVQFEKMQKKTHTKHRRAQTHHHNTKQPNTQV